jgi:hypothetical protein
MIKNVGKWKGLWNAHDEREEKILDFLDRHYRGCLLLGIIQTDKCILFRVRG